MNIVNHPSICRVRSLASAVLVLSLGGVLIQSEAPAATLTDNNSTVYVNPVSQAGMYQWWVDGVNQVAQQQFWYRVGPSGPEASIDTLGAPAITQADARHLDLLYSTADFSIDVLYVLTGNTPGSGNSGINATLTVKNLTGSGLDFHFFQYSDFDLNNTVGGQSVSFSQFAGHYNKATQTLGAFSLGNTFSSGLYPPSLVEAALYPQTLTELNDASATALNGTASAAGAVTYAVEWDAPLVAEGQTGDSLQISELMSLHVPEPSALALFFSAALLVVARKRNAS